MHVVRVLHAGDVLGEAGPSRVGVADPVLSRSGAEPVYVRAPRRPPLERELYRNANP